MNKIFSLFAAFSIVFAMYGMDAVAQGMAINTSGDTANGSALLDVSSTTQGVLVPRMTQAQRNSIPSPATGLMIYQIDEVAGFYYYSGSAWKSTGMPVGSSAGELLYWNGSAWVSVAPGSKGQVLMMTSGVPAWTTPYLKIGDSYGGGKVAYILRFGDIGYTPTEQHGFITTASDSIISGQPVLAAWGATATSVSPNYQALGQGMVNTTAMIATYGTSNTYAATRCAALTINGFNDWYLPSYNELLKMYENRALIGGFIGSRYWTSSQAGADNAYFLDFALGTMSPLNKAAFHIIRPIRAF